MISRTSWRLRMGMSCWRESSIVLCIARARLGSVDPVRLGADVRRLQGLQMVKYYKGGHILHLTDPIIERHNRMQQKAQRSINSDAVIWKP